MKSKTRPVRDKVSTAIQTYIDAYERRPRNINAGDVFLALPIKIRRILLREVPLKHLCDILNAVIERRLGRATVH